MYANVTTTKTTPPRRGQRPQDDSHCRREERREEGIEAGTDAYNHMRKERLEQRPGSLIDGSHRNITPPLPTYLPTHSTASPSYEIIPSSGTGHRWSTCYSVAMTRLTASWLWQPRLFPFSAGLCKVGHKQTAVSARSRFQPAQSCNNSFNTRKLQIQRNMCKIRLKTT